MKKQNTRRAMLASVLSLLLCVSMLVGSTFAWFTDSVTSGNNKIIAGNLDIDVLYANSPDGTYTTIENKNDIFVAPVGATKGLWEPGHTEVAYLKVVNNGTLAAKYKFLVEPVNEVIGKNANGQDIKLSDILMFAATEPSETAGATYTRETAQTVAAASSQKLLNYCTVDQVLEAGETAYIALVVYMPETVGNEANYRGDVIPTINFAVTAVATQAVKESDSFDNNYDEDAVYPVINMVLAGGAAVTEIEAPGTGITVTVPAGTPAGEYTVQVHNKNVTPDAQGETTVSFELKLLKDGVEITATGVKYPVEVFVGFDLLVSEVTHKGEAIAFTYNPSTGKVSFETDSFSPFAVVYKQIPADATIKMVDANGATSYFTTLNEAFAAVNGAATITAKGDMVLTETAIFDQDAAIVLDLNGYTLSGNIETLLKLTAGNITIQNGTIRNVHEAATTTKYSIYMAGNAVAEIKNVTIETSGVGIYMEENAKITELNANVDSFMTANGYCCFDAVSLVGNARIDEISGGEYVTRYTDAFIQSWYENRTYSGIESWAINVNDTNASIGTISGGTFLGVMDKANNGTPIHVNNGKVELISGGYFGFVKTGLSNPIRMLYVGASGNIEKITGGTFEKGSLSAGYGCAFADIVANSGCKAELTGETVNVNIQFSTKVTTYTLQLVEVSAA